ncbi:MAG: PhnD/SsuA/transferrin family substrate-binding protein [bacterium]|nr:phosphonate ABC transporter substrate-binding protein [Deltaproteobacteria bacterium]MCP4904801.1 PhnD/SsuA/transferrin family substrate-binding protein [bacterium]
MVEQFAPALSVLESTLSRELGEPVRVRIKVSSTYTGGVNELVDGRVDFARMGPASYVMAKEMNPGIQLIAIESNKGKKTFQGVICVHADSPIQHVSELEGERFAFGDPQSTIGRFLAQQMLLDHGIGANELGGFDYLGRHDKVGMAVASQMYVAGALKEGTFKKLSEAGEPLRVIATFPNVTKPWIARVGLDPRVFGAIQEALLSMEDRKALTALNKDGFLPANDSDYNSIRAAIESSRSFGG